jgi:hypothetical protein
MQAVQQQQLLASLVLLAEPTQAPLLTVALLPPLLMAFLPMLLLLLAEATTPVLLLLLVLLLLVPLQMASSQLLHHLLSMLVSCAALLLLLLLLLQQHQVVVTTLLLSLCWQLLELVLHMQVLLMCCPGDTYCLLQLLGQVSDALLHLLPAQPCSHCWLAVRPCTASEANAVQHMAACCWSCLQLCTMLALQKHQHQHLLRCWGLPQLNHPRTHPLQQLLRLPLTEE